MGKITFEKEGKLLSVDDDKENIKCMELSGWRLVTIRNLEPAIAKPLEPVTITPQPEVKRSPGRPRNVVPSILNGGEE